MIWAKRAALGFVSLVVITGVLTFIYRASPDEILTALLVVSLAFAVALILISMAMVGRKIADLEYQEAAGLDGVRRLQAIINIRTHANRVLLGVSFVIINGLLLADAPIEVRTWTNRILFTIVMASYTIASLLDWLDERKQLRIRQARTVTTDHDRAFAAGHAEATAEGVATSDTEAQAQTDRMEALGIDTNDRIQRGDIGRGERAIVARDQADRIETTGDESNRILKEQGEPVQVAVVPPGADAAPVAIQSITPEAVADIVTAASGVLSPDPPQHPDVP